MTGLRSPLFAVPGAMSFGDDGIGADNTLSTQPEESADIPPLAKASSNVPWHYGRPSREQRDLGAGAAIVDLSYMDLSYMSYMGAEFHQGASRGEGALDGGELAHEPAGGSTSEPPSKPTREQTIVGGFGEAGKFLRDDSRISWVKVAPFGSSRAADTETDFLTFVIAALDPSHIGSLVRDWHHRGGRIAGAGAFEALRVRSGVLWPGVDDRPPNDAGLRAVGLFIDAQEWDLPALGAPVRFHEHEAGIVTSSAYHWEEGAVGLAWLDPSVPDGSTVTVGSTSGSTSASRGILQANVEYLDPGDASQAGSVVA
ncbi:MAG: hypothetical protein SPI12_06690 [Actinomycetaceae bacterium]|nr:hypothetical protein [Actinomycetaceae bacterium]MDY6083522.1 hypothetical protein [Actinomycetaceae bacterium]